MLRCGNTQANVVRRARSDNFLWNSFYTNSQNHPLSPISQLTVKKGRIVVFKRRRLSVGYQWSAPFVTGFVFMWRFRLFLGQCTLITSLEPGTYCMLQPSRVLISHLAYWYTLYSTVHVQCTLYQYTGSDIFIQFVRNLRVHTILYTVHCTVHRSVLYKIQIFLFWNLIILFLENILLL